MRLLLLLLLFVAVDGARSQSTSPTVANIRRADALTCGIDQSEPEYSVEDEHGPRVAFDRELCRAVAAAILGPRARILVKGYPDNDTALAALRAGEIDLVPTVSDDFTHANAPGIALTRPVLIDAEGFLVLRASGILKPGDLAGKKVCFLTGSEAEANLHTWFSRRKLALVPFPFQEEGEMDAAFVTGNCAALAGDLTRLTNTRAAFGRRAGEYTLLEDTIALDPLAMASAGGDAAFSRLLDAVFSVLVAAEELGVSQAGSSSLGATGDPVLRRLLGRSHELAAPLGLALGLDQLWPSNVLAATGNYGEIYSRTLGEGSPLKLPRGLDALWSQGGALVASPLK